MKKLMMIFAACFALAACGDGSNRSEANRDNEDEYTNTEPSFESEDPDDESERTDTTRVMSDTTDTHEIPSR